MERHEEEEDRETQKEHKNEKEKENMEVSSFHKLQTDIKSN